MRKPLSKRKEYKYIKKVINSCQNHLHLQSVTKMITNFQQAHDGQELNDWNSISPNANYTIAMKTDGTLYTWMNETNELMQYMMWRKEKIEYMNKIKLKG